MGVGVQPIGVCRSTANQLLLALYSCAAAMCIFEPSLEARGAGVLKSPDLLLLVTVA